VSKGFVNVPGGDLAEPKLVPTPALAKTISRLEGETKLDPITDIFRTMHVTAFGQHRLEGPRGACRRLPITFAEFRHGPSVSMRRKVCRFSACVLARSLHLIDAEGDSKMIRIQTASNLDGITITIDGQLIGEYFEEVEISIRKAIEQRNHVHLFLRDVSYIDETGRALLSRLAAQGVELSAAGVYSSYVVTEIQRALASRQSRGLRFGV
jgi:hypothetical protein